MKQSNRCRRPKQQGGPITFWLQLLVIFLTLASADASKKLAIANYERKQTHPLSRQAILRGTRPLAARTVHVLMPLMPRRTKPSSLMRRRRAKC